MEKENWLNSLKKANDEYRKLIRESIQTALFQLLEKEDYYRIKITEVIKRAGVSRSAFYRNYTSLDDVISEELKRLYRELVQPHIKNSLDSWKELLTKIDENKKVYKALIKSGLESRILDSMNSYFADRNLEDKIFYFSINGIIYNIIYEWCRGALGNDLTPVVQSVHNSTRHLFLALENHDIKTVTGEN
ncbi:MAG: TetR/AcrR family transcriptional regulator [Treponema sp.]|nr:TetR/AcrR family transcriptional regulator [Treponema sp.]